MTTARPYSLTRDDGMYFVKEGLVSVTEHYPYSSVCDYAGEKDLVNVCLIM